MNRHVPYFRSVGLLITALLASACVAVPSTSPATANPAVSNSASTAIAPTQPAASASSTALLTNPPATPTTAVQAKANATLATTPATTAAGSAAQATESLSSTPAPFEPRLVAGRTGPPVIANRTPTPLQDVAAAGQAVDEFLVKYQSFGGFDAVVHVEVAAKVALDKAYGFADARQNRPMTLDTRFWIYDLSNSLTAAAVLTLQEQGKLAVEERVCKYVPECPTGWKDLTIRHLLTHTDGLPEYTQLPGSAASKWTPLPLEEVVGNFRDAPLDFSPGSKWKYNRSGYVLASYVIEKASGMSYENYLKSAVLQPLGMTDTGLGDPGPNAAVGNAGVPATAESYANGYGASGLYSTAADLARWARALMGEGGLSENVRNLLLSDQVAMAPVLSEGWYGYGIGAWVNRGWMEWGDSGYGEGFRCTMYFEPEAKLVVVALMNNERIDMQSFFTAFEKKLFAD